MLTLRVSGCAGVRQTVNGGVGVNSESDGCVGVRLRVNGGVGVNSESEWMCRC